MDNYQTMVQVMHYIEQHPLVSVQELADFSGYTLYHFCHSFQEFMGMAPAAYVRRKRLEKSAQMILDGHNSTKTAEACGFETSAGFAKAFRKQFGLAPLEYRKTIRNYWANMTPRIEWIEQKKVVGYLFTPPDMENFTISRCGGAWKGKEFSAIPQPVYDSVTDENLGEISLWTTDAYPDGFYRQVVGLISEKDMAVPEGLVSADIPAGQYAVFDLLTEGTIWDLYFNAHMLWHGIFEYWLPSSDFEFYEGKPCYEFYLGEKAEVRISIRPKTY